MSSLLFQSGDITFFEPAEAPKMTQYTSGSWSWEGVCQLPSSLEDPQSIFRIEKNDDILVNLVVLPPDDIMSDYNSDLTSRINLFVDGYQATSEPKILEIGNYNMFDGSDWHVTVYHGWDEIEPTWGVRITKSIEGFIVESITKEMIQ